MPTKLARRLLSALPLLCAATGADATEGALGRPVTGTSSRPTPALCPPSRSWPSILASSTSTARSAAAAPIAGKASLGIDAQVAFTLATVMKVWDTGPGAWNFASSFTLSYVWTKVTANLSAGRAGASTQDTASNLFDIYFTPIIAVYHSKTEHVALSLNIWAPTGKYDPNALANPSLNNWTFVPQVAYTKLFPEHGLEFDAVAGLQFYTRNSATGYQNAPLFTLDTMLLKRFSNGAGVGLIAGTTQQLGDDSGPLADSLNGFRGHDWAMGPIVTYDTKIGARSLLSAEFALGADSGKQEPAEEH